MFISKAQSKDGGGRYWSSTVKTVWYSVAFSGTFYFSFLPCALGVQTPTRLSVIRGQATACGFHPKKERNDSKDSLSG